MGSMLGAVIILVQRSYVTCRPLPVKVQVHSLSRLKLIGPSIMEHSAQNVCQCLPEFGQTEMPGESHSHSVVSMSAVGSSHKQWY